VNTPSVLTTSGEQFLADIIQDRRDGDDEYFISDLCEEWGLERVIGAGVRIPTEYGEYDMVTDSNVPLLLKTRFGLSNPTQIRTHPRNACPRFFNELFGEICVWKEALQRGEPHTDLFAPVFRYDTENFEWAVVGFATDIQHRNRPATKQVEEQGRELGWVPDDTEVGLLEGRYVAIDYGWWWRQNDEWITGINELPYIDSRTIDHGEELEPLPDDMPEFEDPGPKTPHDTISSTHQSAPSDSRRTRFQQWLSSLFS
jgi:hypothetical protein